MKRAGDTIVAVATPPGRGGVGVVRVSGPRAPDIMQSVIGRVATPRVATVASFRGTLDAVGVADHRQQWPRIFGLVVLIVDEAVIVDMAAIDIGQERAVRITVVAVWPEADDRVVGIDRLNLETGVDRQQLADALGDGEP